MNVHHDICSCLRLISIQCNNRLKNYTWKKKEVTNTSVTLFFLDTRELWTSTSHKALELVAAVADVRPVVLRKTYCFFLYSSPVRNFSCSAWNIRTTSPWKSPVNHHDLAFISFIIIAFFLTSVSNIKSIFNIITMTTTNCIIYRIMHYAVIFLEAEDNFYRNWWWFYSP